jgi:hypothetical protein
VFELTGGRLDLEVIAVLDSATDYAAAVYRMRVTRPNGSGIDWDQVNLYRLAGGRIVEAWQNPLSRDDQERVDRFFS